MNMPSPALRVTPHGLRADIQGLRGLAVLIVVLYHAGLSGLGGGFVGVDVFFVISGFVISGLLLGEWQSKGRIDLLNFYARRARRLLPASLAVIAVVVVLLPWVVSPPEQRDVVSAARAAAVYLANFWFAGRAVDYLGGGSHDNPFLHMWSLAIEEQFYLFWPLLLVALGALVRRGWPRRLVAAGIAVVSLASLAGCIWVTATNQPWAFFGMPLRAWEFGAGALALLLARSPGRGPGALVPLVGWLGAAATAASAVAFNETLAFPGAWALAPVLGTAGMLWAVHSGHERLSRWLGCWPLARLGDLSYSWYLWHWPALVFAQQLWPDGGPLVRALAVLAGLAAAAVSLHGLENPIRFSARLPRGRAVWLGLSGVATGLAALALTLRLGAIDSTLQHDPYRQFAAAVHDRAAPTDPRCQADFDRVELGPCVFGVPGSSRTVVLVGDSHASHWFPAMQALAQDRGWKLVSLSKTACPMLDAEVPLANRQRPYHECRVWREAMVARIEALRPAMVVVANHGGGYNIGAAAWERGMAAMLPRLAATGAAVAVLHDTPWPAVSAPQCLGRAQWRGEDPAARCRYTRQEARARNAASLQAEQAAIARTAGTFGVNLEPAFCDGASCEVFAAGVVRYTDSHHLSATFVRLLVPALGQALQQPANRQAALLFGPATPGP